MEIATVITCNKCNDLVQLTRSGTNPCCICGNVIPYKGDHSLRRKVCKFLHPKGSSNSPRSSDSSSANFNVNTSSAPLASCKSSSTGTSSTYLPSGSAAPASVRSRPNKRALLCGVSYQQHKYKLKGTRNDVCNMNSLLMEKFGYREDCIRILSDDPHALQERIPTKKNIEKSLHWLVEGCQPGDFLVFYFSGPGLRQPDFHDDEIDGFDETICPVDFMKEGMILDNDINKTIVWPLKEGVTLHAIVDACHSGTILDLEYVYNRKKKDWTNNIPPSGARKSTSGGLAISLSACEDDKMAADTTAFSGKVMNGAMTYILTDTVRNNSQITYGLLLEKMVIHIEKVNRERWINSRILRKVFRHKIIQEPLLSSSQKFDIYNTKFIL